MIKYRHLLFILLFINLLLSPIANAKKFHKICDENGENCYYSDTLKPTQVRKERTVIDQHGITVKKIKKAKSRDQIEKEREQAKLQKQEAERAKRQAEKQAIQDAILLKTYLSSDDIIKARDHRIKTLDSSISLLKGNIHQYQTKLKSLRQKATNYELMGKLIPENLQKKIQMTKNRIINARSQIKEKEAHKVEIRQDFQKDLDRFQAIQEAKEAKQKELEQLRSNNQAN